MHRTVELAAALGLVVVSCAGLWGAGRVQAQNTPVKQPDPVKQSAAGFAVVELFTSEGCSSCPPADDVLGAVAEKAAKDGTPVYALAFHVDYWDNLGHKDPFGAAAWSERQRAYAAAWKKSGLYTPQMVVNGAAEFNGSDRAKATREIDTALAAPGPVKVTLTARTGKADDKPGAVEVGYAVTGAARGSKLVVVLTEDGLATSVKRGENAGRTLKHAGVVRVLESKTLGEPAGDAGHTGTVRLVPPAGVDLARSRVTGFVQEDKTLRIIGAAGAALPR